MNEQALFFHFLVPTPSQTRYREYSANPRRGRGIINICDFLCLYAGYFIACGRQKHRDLLNPHFPLPLDAKIVLLNGVEAEGFPIFSNPYA